MLDVFTKLAHIVFAEVLDAGIGIDLGFGEDLLGRGQADAEDVGQADLHTLFPGQVYARNTCHVWLHLHVMCSLEPKGLLKLEAST